MLIIIYIIIMLRLKGAYIEFNMTYYKSFSQF